MRNRNFRRRPGTFQSADCSSFSGLRFQEAARYCDIWHRIIFETDDETGSAYHQGLDELERLRQELVDKYKKYLEDDEFDTMDKILGILEHEIKVRLFYLKQQEDYQIEKEGKSR